MKKINWTKKRIKTWIKDVLITYETGDSDAKKEAIKMLKFLYNEL